MKDIRFLKWWNGYRKDDVAAFADDLADTLIQRKFAEDLDAPVVQDVPTKGKAPAPQPQK
jgi:hypothetical protein